MSVTDFWVVQFCFETTNRKFFFEVKRTWKNKWLDSVTGQVHNAFLLFLKIVFKRLKILTFDLIVSRDNGMRNIRITTFNNKLWGAKVGAIRIGRIVKMVVPAWNDTFFERRSIFQCCVIHSLPKNFHVNEKGVVFPSVKYFRLFCHCWNFYYFWFLS